jgi:hypothetical protein
VKRVLATGYEPQLGQALNACAGPDQDARWAARACFPIGLGTEGATGRALEMGITCSDMCPQYTVTFVAYSGVRSMDECIARSCVTLSARIGGEEYVMSYDAKSGDAARWTSLADEIARVAARRVAASASARSGRAFACAELR